MIHQGLTARCNDVKAPTFCKIRLHVPCKFIDRHRRQVINFMKTDERKVFQIHALRSVRGTAKVVMMKALRANLSSLIQDVLFD